MKRVKPIKRRLVDLRPRTYALLLIGWVLLWAVLLGIASVAFGQSPAPLSVAPEVCLVHPETILRDDPAGRPVVAWVRPAGYPVQVDARDFLRHNSRRAPVESAAVAAQYSIALHRLQVSAARGVSLRAYLPEEPTAPDVSLYSAVWGYLWSGHPLQRSNLAYWLTRAVESPANRACNPWRNYGGLAR